MIRGWQVDYTRDEVELLLGALWNDGISDSEVMMTPGMPKAKVNPARMGNNVVYVIDMQRTLARTSVGMNANTLAGLFLRYGEGWTYEAIASLLKVTRRTITEALDEAVSTLTLAINGRATPVP